MEHSFFLKNSCLICAERIFIQAADKPPDDSPKTVYKIYFEEFWEGRSLFLSPICPYQKIVLIHFANFVLINEKIVLVNTYF